MRDLFHGILLTGIGLVWVVCGAHIAYFSDSSLDVKVIMTIVMFIGMWITIGGTEIVKRRTSIGQWDDKMREALK